MEHKQKYFKRENFKVQKENLQEITGTRSELAKFLGEVIDCEVYVTNTIGYHGQKRLLTEIRIPNTNYFCKHAWVKEHNCPLTKITHGYRTLKLRVTSYFDQTHNYTKYSLEMAEKVAAPKIIIPKWKQEMLADEKLKKAKKETPTTRQKMFGKIKTVKSTKKYK